MNITLYKNKSDVNVVNKVLQLMYENVSCKAKDNISIMNPTVLLKYNENYLGCNYAYIDTLQRYYYINDIQLVPGSSLVLSLSVDALYTYRDQIKATEQLVTRQEHEVSVYQRDTRYPMSVKKDISVIELSNAPFILNSANTDTPVFVLQTAGWSDPLSEDYENSLTHTVKQLTTDLISAYSSTFSILNQNAEVIANSQTAQVTKLGEIADAIRNELTTEGSDS